MKCARCGEERHASQCAHFTCKVCGESLANCFHCDGQPYPAVDAFRRDHVCDELAMRREK